VILRIDPQIQATQLMIRVPKDFHVPRHWHSANETHTIISGTFILRHAEGEREALYAGVVQLYSAQHDPPGVDQAG
jgi:hypothetical protein